MIQDLGTYVITKLSSYLRTIVIKETVPKKTGELAKSITVRGSGKNTKVGTNKKYARMVHFGSDKPVVIRPRYKKALFWPGAEHPVKKVVLYKNKPREPNPFFFNAIEKASKNLESPAEINKVFPKLTDEMREKVRKVLPKILKIQ